MSKRALIEAGLRPKDAAAVMVRGDSRVTDEERDAMAHVSEEDIAEARARWYYDQPVARQFLRILDATPLEQQVAESA